MAYQYEWYFHRKITFSRKQYLFMTKKKRIFFAANKIFLRQKKNNFWRKWNIFMWQREKDGLFFSKKNISFAPNNYCFFATKKLFFRKKNLFVQQKILWHKNVFFSTESNFSMSVFLLCYVQARKSISLKTPRILYNIYRNYWSLRAETWQTIRFCYIK